MHTTIAVFILTLLGAARLASPQVFTTPKGEAQNVTFEQVGGATVHIVYDLVSTDSRAVFSVTLEGSQDRGASYTVHPKSVSGDIGPGIKPGVGKRIVWESARDIERLEIDQFRFRITAQAGPLELKVDPPAAAATSGGMTTVEKPAATPPPQTQAPAAKKGGSAKWVLIGGGAAAAGAAAAVAGGSGGTTTSPGTTSSQPTTSTPTSTPTGSSSKTYTGPYTGQGTNAFITSFPGRTTECIHTKTLSGTLTITLQQQANGSVTGTATTTTTETIAAVSATCSTDIIGTTVPTLWETAVTGTVQNAEFREPKPYSSVPINGGALSGTRTLRFSGRLVDGAITGTMTLDVSATGNAQGNPLTQTGSLTATVTLR